MFNRIKRNILVKLMCIIENRRDLNDRNIKRRLQNVLAETTYSYQKIKNIVPLFILIVIYILQ